MSYRVTITAILAALVASSVYLWPSATEPGVYAPISGRNNTVLYLTDSSSDLVQSHIASAFALLETRPDIQIYWGSFGTPAIEPYLRNISADVQAKNPNVKPINFHELGGQSMTGALSERYRLYDYITEYGLAGYGKMLPVLEDMLMPWDTKEYFALFQETVKLIEDVDPALIVVDNLPRVFVDAARNTNRRFAILSANSLSDILAYHQPWKSMFWKYPALMSGHEFPVPAHSIFPNIWMQIRLMATITASSKLHTARSELEVMGINEPMGMHMQWDSIPLISGDLLEASLPLSYHPTNLTICGPMTLDPIPAEEQNPELVEWLDSSSSTTILVYLGDAFTYDKERTRKMSNAIWDVLRETDVQVLWQYEMNGDFSNTWHFELLKPYVENGRLRIYSQPEFDVDPISLVNSGKIDVWVHHGTTEYYRQAVRAGVRQVIVPLWLDQYNVARLVEYVGVGVWPGKDTAPVWDDDTLFGGFLEVLQRPGAELMKRRASDLKEVVAQYSGRHCAAEQIAWRAGMGH
ncbi:glycosyltransferase family 1 [Penicillium angulare]|uniref:glycosyltransferase family 1 n=1 Tax=Penicillium angulare TaxID=116970 RepID=UPI00253F9931|nr:glycosyltransferase family 1 [Penicillium angulare]KAJ5287239.1 glycosyltransferase family 1 [Penicillium angulare]